MKDLVDTTEMYLRTIFELEEEGITPLRARIAERLEQSGPTVSQTVSRMERDSLLHVRPDRSLEMTEEGRRLATSVMRKHRLAERLLTDVLGLDIHQVHDEACRWEHVMSVDVERRVVTVLDDPTRSPFGNPIPGLGELGVADQPPADYGIRAVDVTSETPVKARIIQINEIIQVNEEQFRELEAAGMLPGAEVTVHAGKKTVTLTNDAGIEIELEDSLAHALRIELL